MRGSKLSYLPTYTLVFSVLNMDNADEDLLFKLILAEPSKGSDEPDSGESGERDTRERHRVGWPRRRDILRGES